MTRLRQDRQSARDERDGAARVQRPDVDSAQRVLALQRTAGNRAVSAMLQRMPDAASKPWQSPKGWDALWGDGPHGERGTPPPGAAIEVLDSVLRDETPDLQDLGGMGDPGLTQTMIMILANDREVAYWREAGCVEVDGDDVYLHRPAPTEAVAGWLGLAPVLPQYLPRVPPEFAMGSGKRPLRRASRPDRALQTAEALEVAIYLLDNKLQHQRYLARGLARAEHQMLAVRILALLCGRIAEVAYATTYGMQVVDPDGSTHWERPAPASAIASRLGIGPQ